MKISNKVLRSRNALAAGVLSVAMVLQPMTAFAVEPTGDTPEVQDGDTLYLVNCATTDPSVVPSGYDMGMCQSNVDQEYGQDSTGYSWGYDENDLSGKTDGSSPSDLTSSSWYISAGAVYDEATSGIKYEFDLPEGVDSVEVTAGVFIPQWWDDRTVVIELEGEDAGSMNCVDNVLSEETYTVNVDDGVLDFRAKAAADRGDDANKDPMLSYIIVKADVEEEEPEAPSVLTIQSVEANSYQSGNEASKAIDGSTGTHWHSSWATGHPTVADGLYITMDMGQEISNLSQLTYTPRQDRDSNGIYTEYEISVSTDGSEYTKVAEGTWAADKDVKTATFPETAARYVRLTAVHTMGNSDSEADQYACAAELALGAVGDWDRDAEKAALSEALAAAQEYLDSENGKTETELARLNGMIEDAEKTAADGYLAVKEELSGLEVVDDYTVKITLKEPFGAFLSALAFTACSIYDEEATEAAGADFGMVPEATVGSGPFIFESWTPNAELVLTRNDDYWNGPAQIPGVVIRIIPDTETQTMMYESGELDLLDLKTNPEAVDRITETYPDQIVTGPILGVDYVFMNQNVEPLNDVRVRKAIQMAIDRQMILDELYGGRGSIENGLLATGMIGYNDSLPEIPYDPEGAMELLAEAGYPDGFTIELGSDSSDSEMRTMITEIIQSMLAEVGINVEIKKYDQSTWLETRRAGEMPMYVSSWTADFNDPDNFFYTFFGTQENSKIRSINYPDTSVMQEVAKARTIVDEDERMETYHQLETKLIQDDACMVPLWSLDHLFAVSQRTKGFKVSWNGFSDSSFYPVYFEE